MIPLARVESRVTKINKGYSNLPENGGRSAWKYLTDSPLGSIRSLKCHSTASDECWSCAWKQSRPPEPLLDHCSSSCPKEKESTVEQAWSSECLLKSRTIHIFTLKCSNYLWNHFFTCAWCLMSQDKLSWEMSRQIPLNKTTHFETFLKQFLLIQFIQQQTFANWGLNLFYIFSTIWHCVQLHGQFFSILLSTLSSCLCCIACLVNPVQK